LFAKDSRVDFSKVDHCDRTPFWYACYNNNIKTIKILIACGRDLNVNQISNDKMENTYFNNFTAFELTLTKKNLCAKLVESYMKNKHETIRRVRKEMKWITPQAEIFGLTIFLSDNLLKLNNHNENMRRFFVMIKSLNFDLQMVLVNRCYKSTYDNIPLYERDTILRKLAEIYI